MNTFFKTFLICLILCLGFIGYKCFNEDSYSNNIVSRNENSIYSIQKENQPPVEQLFEEAQKPQDQEETRDLKKEYNYTCFFYSPKGQLVSVTRKASTPLRLETAINLLLKGPSTAEIKDGYHSEIPQGTTLLNVNRTQDKIIVNLTSKFGEGGGSQSVENRIRQLSKTIKVIEPRKEIYLYINGKEVEYLGGDGVYIKQPL